MTMLGRSFASRTSFLMSASLIAAWSLLSMSRRGPRGALLGSHTVERVPFRLLYMILD
jgi:hypothetical protein